MKVHFILIAFLFTFCHGFSQWEPLGGPYGGFINDLKNNENFQFAATPHGLYRSQNEGKNWQYLTIKPGTTYACLQIGVWNTSIITDVVSLEDGEIKRYLFKSVDNGETWKKLNRPTIDTYVSIAFNKSIIYIADPENLWVSIDQGKSWKLSSINQDLQVFFQLQLFDSNIYVSGKRKIYKSSPPGDYFTEITLDSVFSLFFVSGKLILAEGRSGKLLRSDDEGQTWTVHNTDVSYWNNFAKIGETYYINTYETVLKSEDQGLTWTNQHSSNFSSLIHLMIGAGNSLITGLLYRGILSSQDSGKSFHASNIGISSSFVESIEISDNRLFAGALYTGISIFDLLSSTWDSTLCLITEGSPHDIMSFNNYLFAIADVPNKIYRSADNGDTWQNVTGEFDYPRVEKFYTFNSTLLSGGSPGDYLWIGKNGGSYWEPYGIEINGNHVSNTYLFTQNGNTLFVAKRKVLFRSLDNGMTWDTSMNGLILENQFSSFHQLYTFNSTIFALEINDSTYYPSIKLHTSYDNGDNWIHSTQGIPVNTYPNGIYSVANVNGILLASMYNDLDGVYVSFDNALSWQPFKEGLDLGGAKEIISDSEYLYAATSGQGVWRRKISDLYTTSIQPVTQLNEISIFPNPSNGNFTLKIDSQFSGKADLVIYDLNGKVCLVKQIVSEPQIEVGTETLSSGLYFLSVRSGDKVYSGKVVIQKGL